MLFRSNNIGNTQRIGIQFVGKEVSGTSFMFIDAISVSNGTMNTSIFEGEHPGQFELSQNYPNPFNPSTNISFTLTNNGHVKLEVFNLLGQKVATIIDAPRSAGNHAIKFDASNLSSGIYLYRLSTENFVETRKMNLIK